MTYSCSGLKFKEDKYYKIKTFTKDRDLTFRKIHFWSSKDTDAHCFEEDNGKEIITVLYNHLELSLDHFYKREASIKIERKPYSEFYLQLDYEEGSNIRFEVAHCASDDLGGIFHGIQDYYSSFRLAN